MIVLSNNRQLTDNGQFMANITERLKQIRAQISEAELATTASPARCCYWLSAKPSLPKTLPPPIKPGSAISAKIIAGSLEETAGAGRLRYYLAFYRPDPVQ